MGVLSHHLLKAARDRQVFPERRDGTNDRTERGFPRTQMHRGHDILEVDVPDSGLRILLPFHDGKASVHVEMRGDQVLRQRDVRVECTHMLGRKHDVANRTCLHLRCSDNDPFFSVANQTQAASQGRRGAEVLELRHLGLDRIARPQVTLAPRHDTHHNGFEQPDGRPDAERKPAHEGREGEANAFRVAQRKYLWDQFADDDCHEGQWDNQQHQGENIRRGLRNTETPHKRRGQRLLGPGPTDSGRDGTDQCDPQLDDSQARLHVLFHIQGHFRPASMVVRKVAQPGQAHGGQGDLVAGENAVDGNHEGHDGEFKSKHLLPCVSRQVFTVMRH